MVVMAGERLAIRRPADTGAGSRSRSPHPETTSNSTIRHLAGESRFEIEQSVFIGRRVKGRKVSLQ